MTSLATYGALGLSAFLAATLLPAQSELGLAYLIQKDQLSVLLLITVASVGNVLGAMVNWTLGRFALGFQEKWWFPVSPKQLRKASDWYQRFGKWSLLLSWAPLIGDPITLIAGLLRTPFWISLLLITLAKVSRYIIIAFLALAYHSATFG